MVIEKYSKLQRLLQIFPEGVIAPTPWFLSQGYSAPLLHSYVKNGWLIQPHRGIYSRSKTISNEGFALGLQHFCNFEVVIGGISALNLQGYAHYLPLSYETLTLYTLQAPPLWAKTFKSVSWKKKPYFHSLGIEDISSSISSLTLKVSSPERAIFELLSDVGERSGISFEFVAEIFASLTSLRPRIIQSLLENCPNIRTKRLFLFLAEYFSHSWLKHIQTQEINLGSGKHQIVKNGVYNSKFLITIPKEYDGKSSFRSCKPIKSYK